MAPGTPQVRASLWASDSDRTTTGTAATVASRKEAVGQPGAKGFSTTPSHPGGPSPLTGTLTGPFVFVTSGLDSTYCVWYLPLKPEMLVTLLILEVCPLLPAQDFLDHLVRLPVV